MSGADRAKGWLFLLVGCLLLAGAGWAALRTRAWLARSAVAPGRVVRLNAGGSHPQVEFVTARGERVSYPQGGAVAGWRTGDRVAVRYDPAAPRLDPCIDRFAALWDAPLTMLGLGMALAGLGMAQVRGVQVLR